MAMAGLREWLVEDARDAEIMKDVQVVDQPNPCEEPTAGGPRARRRARSYDGTRAARARGSQDDWTTPGEGDGAGEPLAPLARALVNSLAAGEAAKCFAAVGALRGATSRCSSWSFAETLGWAVAKASKASSAAKRALRNGSAAP